MKLYLDDVRPTPEDYQLRAYTAQEAIELLRQGTVTFISFDHDLGPVEAGTGYDVAKWIEEEVFADRMKPPAYQVHSANPVGKSNIHAAMQSAHSYHP